MKNQMNNFKVQDSWKAKHSQLTGFNFVFSLVTKIFNTQSSVMQ